jgi:hypothetical protein
LVCSTALGGFVPASYAAVGAEQHAQTEWSRYSYDARQPGILFVTGSFDIRPGSYFAVLDEIDTRGPDPESLGVVVDLDAFGAGDTYGALGNRDLCRGPVRCEVANGQMSFTVEFTVNGDGRHRQHLRQYVIARGAHVVVHDVLLRGWTAAHRRGGALRRTDADAQGAGAMVDGAGAGADLGVSAPGPAGGSLALAVPGCEQAGAGMITLAGGEQSQTALCPTYSVGAVARHKTTWRLTGAVAGATAYKTRLLVVAA